jgi:hypothetical protein
MWQVVFFAGATLLVALQAWRGWRLGVVRQIASILALVVAYVAAFFGGRLFVPMLRPLGFPDQLLAIGAGALLGLIVFAGSSVLAAVLFKRTAEQTIGIVRLGYGSLGALIGALFGFGLVWLAVVSIRVLGTVAETEIAAARRPVRSRKEAVLNPPPPPPGGLVHGLAHMKQSLEQGATGSMLERVDPIPEEVYTALAKVGQMIANEESVSRFLAYPAVKPLAQHPKIVALQTDPEIAREVLARDYVGLLRNERIVSAVNDPEIAALLRKLEFQKALDYALHRPEKRAHE